MQDGDDTCFLLATRHRRNKTTEHKTISLSQHFCSRKHSLGHTVVVHVCVYTGRSTNAVVKPGTGITQYGSILCI